MLSWEEVFEDGCRGDTDAQAALRDEGGERCVGERPGKRHPEPSGWALPSPVESTAALGLGLRDEDRGLLDFVGDDCLAGCEVGGVDGVEAHDGDG